MSKHQGKIENKPKWLIDELNENLNRLEATLKNNVMRGLVSPSYADGYNKAINDIRGKL